MADSGMRIVAAGAHPDDIEIFMGGTMAAWSAMGAELHFVIATDGALGGAGEPRALARQRALEAEQAAAIFGARLHLCGFADGSLTAGMEEIATIRARLAAIRPDLVVTHAPNDYHPDHRALSVIVRQAAGFSVPVLYCDTLMGNGFMPTHMVDIAAHFDTKRAAILCHQSQDPERFVEKCRLQNRFRAAQCGHDDACAEAFCFDPVYPFADIRNLLPPAPMIRPVVPRNRSGV